MVHTWIIYCTFFGCLFTVCTAQQNNGSDHLKPAFVRLSDHLLNGYKKGIRPVYDWRRTTAVHVDIVVFAILGIEEKAQLLRSYLWILPSWVDEFLTWDPEKFDNITQISIPNQAIWNPDIVIVEFVDTSVSVETPYVYVDYQGRIKKSRPLVISTACSLNTYYFPFDTQRCSISLTSWLHTNKDVNITVVEKKYMVNKFQNSYLNDGEWDLIQIVCSFRFLVEYDKNIGEYTLVMRRRPLFYIISLIMPSVFLMVINVAGFYLPPESGERISFKITLILGYSVFLMIVADTLPATGSPLIGIYYLMCMAFLMASLIESIFIVRMVHQHNVHAEIPKWLKRLVLEKLILIMGIQNKMFQELWKNPPKKPQEKETDDTGKIGNCNALCQKENPLSALPVEGNYVVLSKILKEIVSIREHVRSNEKTITKEWLQVAYILDMFIFRAYLCSLIMFGVSLIAIWSISYLM